MGAVSFEPISHPFVIVHLSHSLIGIRHSDDEWSAGDVTRAQRLVTAS
jgi:hypothetical protein